MGQLKELNDYRINGYLRIIESLNDEINTVSKKQITRLYTNVCPAPLIEYPDYARWYTLKHHITTLLFFQAISFSFFD
jgi:hypothetical protein